MTSLTDTDSRESEATLSHASTLADSWIALEYRIHGGERNRALSVVKSRGSSHSNQVRELLLSEAGEKANRHRREIRRQRAADDEHDQNQGSQ